MIHTNFLINSTKSLQCNYNNKRIKLKTFLKGLSDCEELSGGLLKGDDGGGKLLRIGNSSEI